MELVCTTNPDKGGSDNKMKIHNSPSTLNDYYNQIADSNLINDENDLTQSALKHEHIYHIPE